MTEDHNTYDAETAPLEQVRADRDYQLSRANTSSDEGWARAAARLTEIIDRRVAADSADPSRSAGAEQSPEQLQIQERERAATMPVGDTRALPPLDTRGEEPLLLELTEDHLDMTGWPIIVTQLGADELAQYVDEQGNVVVLPEIPLTNIENEFPPTMQTAQQLLGARLISDPSRINATNMHQDMITHVTMRPIREVPGQGLYIPVSVFTAPRGLSLRSSLHEELRPLGARAK